MTLDYGKVLETPIAPIQFNNFYLPPTFRLASINAPRRITQVAIQRSDIIVQQSTYENAKQIEIDGRVFTNQLNIEETLLTCQQALSEIRANMKTRDDRKLYLEEYKHYNARFSDMSEEYVEGTNRHVADVTIAFIASDPYLYDEDEVIETTTIDNTGETFNLINEGNVETPLNIEADITTDTESIQIKFFDNPDSDTHDAVMILDSDALRAGENDNANDLTYTSTDDILINSVELTIIRNTEPILPHLRTPLTETVENIRNLPIMLQPGTNKIEISTINENTSASGEFDVTLKYTSRWA